MTANAPQEKQSTIQVNNVDHFAAILSSWHSNRVKTLEHMFQIPDGTQVEVKNQDGTTEQHVITGDVLTGFKLGLNLSLMELGTLPFVVETSQAPETTDQEETLSGQVAG
jgi:hypothetical protein